LLAAKESVVRKALACMALLGLLAGCDPPGDPAGDASGPMADPNAFRAAIDPERPYAGEWAAASTHCRDEDKIWTIEARRMAVVPDMRFCVFDDIFVSDGAGNAPATWSAGAKCLAQGRESHDFLFFRVDDNLREMRVTFNDTTSVELVRCPMKS
jgi:hypothetical protein